MARLCFSTNLYSQTICSVVHKIKYNIQNGEKSPNSAEGYFYSPISHIFEPQTNIEDKVQLCLNTPWKTVKRICHDHESFFILFMFILYKDILNSPEWLCQSTNAHLDAVCNQASISSSFYEQIWRQKAYTELTGAWRREYNIKIGHNF